MLVVPLGRRARRRRRCSTCPPLRCISPARVREPGTAAPSRAEPPYALAICSHRLHICREFGDRRELCRVRLAAEQQPAASFRVRLVFRRRCWSCTAPAGAGACADVGRPCRPASSLGIVSFYQAANIKRLLSRETVNFTDREEKEAFRKDIETKVGLVPFLDTTDGKSMMNLYVQKYMSDTTKMAIQNKRSGMPE